MFTALFTVALLCLAMQTISVLAHPASILESNIVMKVAVSSGAPFDMAVPTPSPRITARQWVWTPTAADGSPVEPAWVPAVEPSWVPSLVESIVVANIPKPTKSPSSTPSYSYAETHNDNKNTRIHQIIAGIIAGLFIGFPILGCLFFFIYRKCRGPRVKNKGQKSSGRDMEAGNAGVSQGDANNVPLEQPQGKPRHILALTDHNLRHLATPQMVHWSRSQGSKSTKATPNARL